jgi:hypothetical protein
MLIVLTLLSGTLLSNFNLTNEFRFTPITTAKTAVPRPWERMPSTPFLARSKSRKIWKRFRSSFKSAKALRKQVGRTQAIPESELLAEISISENAELLRAVKKLRLSVDLTVESGLTRSFLATKWESEMSPRKRMLSCAMLTRNFEVTSDHNHR